MVLFRKGKQLAAHHEASDAQCKYVMWLARKPYNTWCKAVSIKKTPAEKKQLSAQRAERHEKMLEALSRARDAVTEEAQKMQVEFSMHSEKYYEQQILQNSKVSLIKCKANPWNAYLRRELQNLNDSMSKFSRRARSSRLTSL